MAAITREFTSAMALVVFPLPLVDVSIDIFHYPCVLNEQRVSGYNTADNLEHASKKYSRVAQ